MVVAKVSNFKGYYNNYIKNTKMNTLWSTVQPKDHKERLSYCLGTQKDQTMEFYKC